MNTNRRLLFVMAAVAFFSILVIVWYFFYAKPLIAPSIGETNNPLAVHQTPPRFQFLNWGDTQETSTSTTEVTNPLQKPLVRVWDKPSTGQTFITDSILKEIQTSTTTGTTTTQIKKTIRATSTVILFVDRTTGYIYGYPVETGVPYQISNTVIPGVHDAYFFNNGKRIIMRYIDREKNTVVSLIADVPTVSRSSTALPLENIQYLAGQVLSVAVNPKTDKASYLVTTESGSSIYTITSKNPRFIASSPFKEWTLSYGGDSLFATTKPSAYISGITVSVPSFQLDFSEKTGLLTTPGPLGKSFNSMWGPKGLVTFFSQGGDLQATNIQTLASKCSWGIKNYLVCAIPKNLPRSVEGLPDDWYQGRVSFDDDLYVVEIASGNTEILYPFTQEDGVFDVTTISVSQDNTLLSFIKKQDDSLWMLNTNLLQGE